MLRESTCVVDGVRCRVRETGAHAASEAVVFLHGNPGPSDDWEFVAPDVGEFARAILVDMPGFGVSDRPRHFDYSAFGYARYLNALLEQLGVQRVHLVMHDFGAGWGLLWANEHNDQVASVALINCGVLEGYEWHRFARIWQTPVLGELFQLVAGPAVMHRALNAENPRPMPRAFVDRVFRYADWGHKRAVLKLYRNTKTPQALIEGLTTLPTVPALVLWGDGDKYLPSSYAERQREYFPDAAVHVLPRCGHWPFIDDPAAVRDLLVPFLRRQVSSRNEGP